MKIHRFRNVVPGCEIELSGGINILLGQNGTGKTTLLEWIAGLMSGRMEQWKDEPYEVELELAAEDARAVFRLKNAPGSRRRAGVAADAAGELLIEAGGLRPDNSAIPDFEIDVRIEMPMDRFHFRISSSDEPWMLEHNGQSQTIDRRSSPGTSATSALYAMLVVHFELESIEKASPAWFEPFFPLLDDYRYLRRFDESVGVFARALATAMTIDSAAGMTFRVLDRHTIKLSISIPELHFLDSLLQSQIEEQLSQSQPPGHIDNRPWTLRLHHDELPFLALAVAVFGYRAAVMSSNLVDKRTDEQAEILTFGPFTIHFTRRDGSIINHNQLSYGQKRMLAFLLYLSANQHLIIVDELVNGLHHAWIERAIEQIGERQAIMTSQNPLLLDYLSFESVDEVRKRFILCRSRIDEATGREQLIWRNPTEDEAASVFSAYQAGIQHVGEILRDKGLW